MIDAIAAEPHFLDHLAPVWHALPAQARGRFLVDRSLEGRARALGIEPELLDVSALRRTPQQPPCTTGVPTLVAAIGDIKLGRRMGHGPFAFLEHGAGQSYGIHGAAASYAGGPDRLDNELFLVPNTYSAELWRRAYPAAAVRVVGCPKLESLPAREPGPGPVVALSFHGDWPVGVPYGGTALYDYAPGLAELARRFTVIGHGHPGKGWGGKLERLYKRAGIEYVPEFADVCRRADVYVCDNSSTIYEFASTGRPVVLLNARVWHRGRGPGGRFWDWAGVGVNVDVPAQLGDGIALALMDEPSVAARREATLEQVYAYRTGAARRAAEAVAGWAASKEVAA